MEMEHINENTIRVLIDNDDLAARGITFLDLLGNHKEIENFFYSILEEVDIEEEFRGSEAVTFQVLPKGDGLELFISKNLQSEEIEKMQDMSESSNEAMNQFIREQFLDDPQLDEGNSEKVQRKVFAVADMEDVIALSKENLFDVARSWLYRLNQQLFLQVDFVEEIPLEELQGTIAHILEYTYATVTTPEILSEYGEVILEGNALAQMAYYFK